MSFVDRGQGDEMSLPCGRCSGCRLEHSRQWAARIMFEAQMHDSSCFITLTYDAEHCPFPPSLDYPEFQRFMKRLRKAVRPVRFFVAGEYGDEGGRPHFHACLFGHDFPDRVLWSNLDSGHELYRSAQLESLWPFGFSSVGELSFESAAYVARYVMKKITGDLADEHYAFVDRETGEVSARVPEFCHMSLKPGIGGAWFERFSSDVYNGHDFVVVNGRKCKPPRYFDKLLRRVDRRQYDFIKSDRAEAGYLRRSDSTDSRLAVREAVVLAGLDRLKPRGV